MSHQGKRQPATGLVLTGGGARAAYQAGVLRAVVDILDAQAQSNFASPFDIIFGTSAGAINAAAYACRADRPRLAVHRMCRLWVTLNTSMICRADAPGLIKTGVRWLSLLALGWMFSGLRNKRQSLLNNQPMADLLGRVLDFGKLKENLAHGHVSSLAITASGYTSGEHLTFYQSHDGTIAPWHRSLHMAVPAKIGIDHLIASSAIPFVFPARAVKVHGNIEWCGDGSIRQLAPISPAIHLGADRVMVIGTGYRDDTHPEKRQASPPYTPPWLKWAVTPCPASSWTAYPWMSSAWNA